MAVHRIVSLIASSTEIICALGFEDQLVGRSHECDYPKSVHRLPVCTEPKFVTDGTSYEIDQRVKAVLQEALAVYRVHADLLKSLQPTVIVTQSQCEVCAVSLKDVEQATCDWLERRPRIVSLKPDGLADVWTDIQAVADALESPARGRQLIEKLKRRIEALHRQTRNPVSRRNRVSGPTVACIEWIDPLMAGGNWMPELVELAGGVNLFGESGKHSPHMTWEQLQAADPDVILVMPCGFDIARSAADMPALTSKPGWSNLRAVQEGKVFIADGNQFFNRPGPRLVESLEILGEILHPDQFHFGHKNIGWRRW